MEMIHDPKSADVGREWHASPDGGSFSRHPRTNSYCELEIKGPAKTLLEVLESLPEDEKFETLADVVKACGESDQAPQTGIIEREAIKLGEEFGSLQDRGGERRAR